jgi:hypothetical protein
MVRVGFGRTKALAVRNKHISKLYQLSGCAVTPAAYKILCLRFAHLLFAASTPLLRNGRKTRYGRVVNPYPAGTLTQQDTPSLSWRDSTDVYWLSAFSDVLFSADRSVPAKCSILWPPFWSQNLL